MNRTKTNREEMEQSRIDSHSGDRRGSDSLLGFPGLGDGERPRRGKAASAHPISVEASPSRHSAGRRSFCLGRSRAFPLRPARRELDFAHPSRNTSPPLSGPSKQRAGLRWRWGFRCFRGCSRAVWPDGQGCCSFARFWILPCGVLSGGSRGLQTHENTARSERLQPRALFSSSEMRHGEKTWENHLRG